MSSLDSLYQAVIVEHDRAPRRYGVLEGATHRATEDNPLCGDVVTLYLRLEGGVIRDASFEARGCSLSRAAGSMLAERLVGATVGEARQLAAAFEAFVQAPPEGAAEGAGGVGGAGVEGVALGELTAFAGVRRVRSRRTCATLPLRALAAATRDVDVE